MVADEYGFMFPVISKQNCIGCHKCEKVCPISAHEKREQKDECYYAWHSDERKRQNSTSGAAFVGIAELCHTNGYDTIYGAVYDKNLVVKHEGVEQFSDIQKMICSKYVQSDMNTVFTEINAKLEQGKRILFVGTPCQVDGLESTIQKKYREQVLTVALICHGVASPMAFKRYIEEIENKYNAKVINVRFRDKKLIDGELSHRFTTILLDNGIELSSTDNLYTLMFGIGTMTRESCFKCPFASPDGAGDITIGDFWGLTEKKPELLPEVSKGISLLIPHTERGSATCKALRNNMMGERVPLEYAVNPYQKQLIQPMDCPPDREKFLENVTVKNRGYQKLALSAKRKWIIRGYIYAIKRRIDRFTRKNKK